MSKTYKGYELYKMIAEGKIKEGTKFKANQYIIKFNGDNFIFANSESPILFRHSDKKVAEMDFELIEDEIDIQSIKETEILNNGIPYYEYNNNGHTESGYSKNYNPDDIETRQLINELTRAVKQLERNKEDKQC